MPQIEAFRALRYDLGHVGSLSDVVAPPYDVIGPDLQDQLYKRHPANCIRLILNRDEPGDDDRNNRYSRAARFLKNWREEGVLRTESDPAVYVYHSQFDYAGKTYRRRGFMARIRLERFGEGKIFPHEETMAGPKQDRLLITRACKANLSQVFGLYPDSNSESQQLLEAAIAGAAPIEATDHLGVIHRIWPVADVQTISRLAALMGPKPVFIADGHHRYETACNYRDELAARGPLPASHPANYVLMMCVGMSDPGMIVLPTHRLFRGLPAMNSGELIAKLGTAFTTRIAGEGADLAPTVWEEIEYSGEQGTLGLYTAADERWVVATITDAGRAKMAELAADHSAAWQGLGVAVLHRLVVDHLLAARDLPKPRYVHLVDEVVEGLAGDEFPLAALVMPATVDHVRQISEHRERMPAKS
ncbi:MAG: phosphatase, partial [Planctomycetia bacterium 21-64-5]